MTQFASLPVFVKRVSPKATGFILSVGTVAIGSIYFESRCDDGKQWVMDDFKTSWPSMPRFASIDHATNAICSRIGLTPSEELLSEITAITSPRTSP